MFNKRTLQQGYILGVPSQSKYVYLGQCLAARHLTQLFVIFFPLASQLWSRTPSACSDGTTVGVFEFRITRSLGARLNTALIGTSLHHSRRTKLTNPIELKERNVLEFGVGKVPSTGQHTQELKSSHTHFK